MNQMHFIYINVQAKAKPGKRILNLKEFRQALFPKWITTTLSEKVQRMFVCCCLV